jgi:hypothetical protein
MKHGVCLLRTQSRPGEIERRTNSGSRAPRTSDMRKDRIQPQAKRRLLIGDNNFLMRTDSRSDFESQIIKPELPVLRIKLKNLTYWF